MKYKKYTIIKNLFAARKKQSYQLDSDNLEHTKKNSYVRKLLIEKDKENYGKKFLISSVLSVYYLSIPHR